MTTPGMIVMAVHRPNRALLHRQIRSLQEQYVRDWTCLVGIDGEDAETFRFIRTVVADDPRFDVRQYVDNLGHYRHFERLLEAVPAAAPWFALCDQDDVWYPEKLETLIAELRRPTVTASMGQAAVTDASGDVLGQTIRRVGKLSGLLVKNQVTGCFLVADCGVLATALPFPEGGPCARHDHWIGVASLARGRVTVRADVLQDYVQHGGNAIGERNPRRPSYAVGRALLPWHALQRLSRDQWGWRVTMARALLARVELTPSLADPIDAFARGRLSFPLLKVLVMLVFARSIRVDVAVGALVGALCWPLVGRRTADVRHRRGLG